MMLFQRRLFAELLRNCVTTLIVLTVVVMLVLSARIVHVVDGLDAKTFATLLPIHVAMALDLLIPMSALVAVVLTYSRAAADNEVDTLRASGVHPLHLFVPGLVFGMLMSVLMLWVMDEGKPRAERAYRHLTKSANLVNVIKRQLAEGKPVELDDGTTLSADGIDPETAKLVDMRIQIFDPAGDLEREILATNGELYLNHESNSYKLVMEDYRSLKGPKVAGKKLTIERPLQRELYELRPLHLTTAQLMAWLRRPDETRKGYKPMDVLVHVHTRQSVPLACVLFVLVGLPVAIMFRSQDRVVGFLAAFLLALFVYYPTLQISNTLARNEVLPVAVAAWAGNAFLLAVGLVASWVVVRR